MKTWIFEGVDGTGKSSLIEAMSKELSKTQILRFPSRLPTGKDKKTDSSNILFYLNDFKEELNRVGDCTQNLLLDRSFLSTLAYQGFAMGTNVPSQYFSTIMTLGAGLFSPFEDMNIVHLKCDVEESLRRISSRPNGRQDDMESLEKEELAKTLKLFSERYSIAISCALDHFRNVHSLSPEVVQIDNTNMSLNQEIDLLSALTS